MSTSIQNANAELCQVIKGMQRQLTMLMERQSRQDEQMKQLIQMVIGSQSNGGRNRTNTKRSRRAVFSEEEDSSDEESYSSDEDEHHVKIFYELILQSEHQHHLQ